MSLSLSSLKKFNGRKGPLLLIVMDGVGIMKDHAGNAVSRAHTPVLDTLMKSPLFMPLKTHGGAVGLPNEGDMGNSEVGHTALGAGRIIPQGASLVNQAIESGALFENTHWQQIIHRTKTGGTLHFLGLLSDGNVHANIEHLFALLSAALKAGVKKVRVHTLLDGRDVTPQSALKYLTALDEKLTAANQQGMDYKIASGGGRQIITMDRYNANLAMVKEGYECHVQGIGKQVVSAQAAVKDFYAANPDGIDQDIPAFVVADKNGKAIGAMQDGDAVVLTNFRGDRAMAISRALEQKKFDEFHRAPLPDLYFCSMIEYDGDLQLPKQYLVTPPAINNTMVEYLCAENLRSFAISETQKFGHVTYFWNGNRSGYICEALESYVEVKSDLVPFNQKPKMKAIEITDATISRMRQDDMRFGRINFANGDMVGHTGDFEAAKIAVETVDQCVGELIKVASELGGIVLVTADHGNVEEIFFERAGEKAVKTSHTLNPVPFVIVDAEYAGEYALRTDIKTPGLANIAATVFNLLGYEAPDDYEPSLIEFNSPS